MSLVRTHLRSFALAGYVACGAVGLTAQIGCGGGTHTPPKLDDAAIEAEAQKQLDIRKQEMGGGK